MDLRLIISLFLLLGSFIAITLGIIPAWQSINESIVSKRNVEKTVRDLKIYFDNFDSLKKDIKDNLTLEKCNRLNNIAPGSIDLPQLLLQFDNLASAYGTQMLGLNVGEGTSISDDPVSFKKSTISVFMPISLDNILSFLDSIYRIERLVDIKSVKISVAASSGTDIVPAAINGLDGVVYSVNRSLDCESLTK